MAKYTTISIPLSRPPGVEQLRQDIRDTNDRIRKAEGELNWHRADSAAKLLHIQTGQQWIEGQRQVPAPRQLFGPFWAEGELCLLFADTNMGKTLLAVQLGNAISWGQPVGGPFGMGVHDAAVLYLDFELSAKQFELRYPDAHNRSLFSKRFYRAELRSYHDVPPAFKNMDEYMVAGINYALKETGARVLIIDNIACLQRDTGYAGGALPLMQYLNGLKLKQKLSILVLAHTPKRRPHQPLTRDDLHGSKLLMNFADSAFAIGESHALPGHRYLKQIKQRSGAEVYGADNVCVCKISPEGGVLHYEVTDEAPESEHLRPLNADASQLHGQILTLHTQHLSQRQIAARLQVSVGLVNKVLNK